MDGERWCERARRRDACACALTQLYAEAVEPTCNEPRGRLREGDGEAGAEGHGGRSTQQLLVLMVRSRAGSSRSALVALRSSCAANAPAAAKRVSHPKGRQSYA
jgi:hypothetical protein